MALTDNTIQKALRVKRVVYDYFAANASMSEVQAKELMPYFIKAGIFTKNHQDGLPIRDLLRELDDSGNLHLIPNIKPVRKDINTNWYFIKV